MAAEAIYYIDGRFLPASEAALPVNDLALLRGYGVFDFIRTYGGRPFLLEEHIARLEESARRIRLPFPWSRRKVIEVIGRTLERNPKRESNIRVIVTGGPSPDFLTPSDRPRLLILVSELKPFPREWYERGVKVITVRGRRPIPSAKTLNYLTTIVALREAAEKGAVEAILVDRSGRVREGQTATVFARIGSRLVTNEQGILPGVTRWLVLKLAASVFPVEIREFTREELLGAEEVFMTANSTSTLSSATSAWSGTPRPIPCGTTGRTLSSSSASSALPRAENRPG
jgi:branched-chain amino acid aminotransferase